MNLASVQIKQLRLRGDTRAKTALLASLDSQTWPGEDDPRIIFIKRLQVKAPWWMLARELAQQSEMEYRAAVTALQANADTNALVFASEASLVAQILVNLLHKNAPWYQQTWLAQTELTAEPMAVLLYRPVLVPEVLQQLQRQEMLAFFFAHCSVTDIQILVARLQDFLGIGSLPNAFFQLDSALPDAAVFTPVLSNSDAALGTKQLLPVAQLAWAKHWLPQLLPQTRTVVAQSLALQLLTCLGLWRFSPQQLRAPAAWSLWFGALVAQARAMNLLSGLVDTRVQSITPPTLAQPSVVAEKNPVHPNAFPMTDSAASGKATHQARLMAMQTKTDIGNDDGSIGESMNESIVEFAEVDYRYIRQAGFLYFINWLRDFEGVSHLPAPFSPWLWLALLQRDCCRAWQLPLDESLQALLLELGGLDEQDLVQGDEDIIFSSLVSAREFLQHRLRDFHLEHTDWLVIPARVQWEQAYVQIYLHESAVRLDLRLAGLDLNPGWVPWLGHVLYFHFGQYPELLREAP